MGLAGDSAIEFASGQITSLAGSLDLTGNDAFIEDSTALGSKSALTGLADIGEGATFTLGYGASLSTTGALANRGLVNIGVAGAGSASGSSTLSIAGALTNTGKLNIFGNYGSVTAESFVNSGTVDLTANGSAFGALNVSGTLTNNGSISIVGDTEELAGAVEGAGSFSLSTEQYEATANLVFDASVSAGQIISETGAAALTLNEAQSFAATISGFGTGDAIDATNFVETATTYNFVENSAMTGGTLTLHDASLTANIQMTGVYSNSSFTLAPDSGTGTLVSSTDPVGGAVAPSGNGAAIRVRRRMISKSTWTGAVNSDWADAGNWSPADIPDASSDVTIASGTPLALASASIGTVNSITDSSDLSFEFGGNEYGRHHPRQHRFPAR